jgi:hypothetical protein
MSRAEVPFVIGQWVCGSRFYGRAAEIAALRGSARWQWVAGLRRIGKTSLLKQLDHLARADTAETVPLFWDLQGAGSAEELGLTFTDALLDAEEPLARQGIAVEEVEDGDVFAALEKLGRAMRSRNAALLLLCDEADELMPLHRAEPGLPARLWQAVEACGAARVVLASSLRLCDFGADLVERFGSPRHLGAMTDPEARALLAQSQLPAASRPSFDQATIEALRDLCGNHPMLLQIAAKRRLATGDQEETFSSWAADPTVQHLFAVDFALLAEAERTILHAVAAERMVADEPSIRRLLELGLLRRGGPQGFTIPNRLLAAWLRQENLIQTSGVPQGKDAADL